MSRTCISRPGRGAPIGPVRDHLEELISAGATNKSIARASKVSERTVRNVLTGTVQSVYTPTARRILALQPAQVISPARVVNAAPTRRRVAEWEKVGWRVVDIAELAGLSPSTLAPHNLRFGVSLETHLAVRRAAEQLRGRDGTRPRTYPALVDQVADLSHRELARLSGVSVSTAGRVKRGAPITRETARKVTAALVRRRATQRASLSDVA